MTVRELAIETKDLTCKFGDFTAVDRLNIKVYSGEIYGFLGSNGSGKSTSIRMLCGILKPAGGTGIVLGYDVVKEPEKVKENIGYMSQKFSLYLDMTVFENLDFYAGMYGLKGEEKYARIEEMIEQMNLKDKRNEFSGNLSVGLKQRLALGCAILHKPRLLFLDEPTSAVDPISRRSFWQIIHALAIGGTTMVVTTHFMEEAEHCDEMVFLDAGKMVAEGSSKKLKDSIKGTLVSIASDDSIKLREEIKKRIPVEDAYIFGRELRVLVAPQDLPLLSDWQYKIIEPTMEEVRGPMGMLKIDHIRTMLQGERIRGLWKETYGRDWTEEDVHAVYELSEKKLLERLSNFAEPKPYVLETVAALREMGMKIGSTTGYTDDMMAIVAPKAKELGYEPDCWFSPNAAGNHGRPYPYMIFRNMEALGLDDVRKVI